MSKVIIDGVEAASYGGHPYPPKVINPRPKPKSAQGHFAKYLAKRYLK